jgi:cytochrome bd-type quinol oxidase subunit 2
MKPPTRRNLSRVLAALILGSAVVGAWTIGGIPPGMPANLMLRIEFAPSGGAVRQLLADVSLHEAALSSAIDADSWFIVIYAGWFLLFGIAVLTRWPEEDAGEGSSTRTRRAAAVLLMALAIAAGIFDWFENQAIVAALRPASDARGPGPYSSMKWTTIFAYLGVMAAALLWDARRCSVESGASRRMTSVCPRSGHRSRASGSSAAPRSSLAAPECSRWRRSSPPGRRLARMRRWRRSRLACGRP